VAGPATAGMTWREEPRGFREAVFGQAENLETAASAARDALAGSDLGPLRSGVVVLTGMGASWHALAPAVRALRRAGRRAFAVHPSELGDARAANLGDAYVVVSQSGASAETVAAVEQLAGAFIAGVSARADAPLAEAADLWLPLGSLRDTPVATLSYTGTLQALGLLCEAVTDAAPRSPWSRLPELVAETLDACDPLSRAAAESLERIYALDAIGSGDSVASAGETALLAREALLIPATGNETRQYLHGPVEAVGGGLGCILFGSGRELRLARSLVSYGASVVIVSDRQTDAAGLTAMVVPKLAGLAAPILEILPVQLLVSHLAEVRGVTIGQLRRQQPDTKLA
jgi:glucosamine--fructose-6-phosphate aminotransferase (isomerizing)